MLKWGKSALNRSSWKHKYSFSTTELEYKFGKNKYKKMDNDFDSDTSFYDRNNDQINSSDNFILKSNSQKNVNTHIDNNVKRKKWLSNSIDYLYSNNENYHPNNNNNSHNNNIHNNNNNSNNVIIPEYIEEKDIMEWKSYVKHEIKNNDYINLNINELLKEFINKNIYRNNSVDNENKIDISKINTSESYRNKTINDSNHKSPTFDQFINSNPDSNTNLNSNSNSNIDFMIPYNQNFNNNSNKNPNNNLDINSNNSNNINRGKKCILTDYDIQTIEYKLKYNSNYEIDNIPEEIIMELLNYQLNSKEKENYQEPYTINNNNINTNTSIDYNSNSNSNTNSNSNSNSFCISSPSMIPTVITKSSSVKNNINNYNNSYYYYNNNNSHNNVNDSDAIMKEDNSFTSELTINSPQTLTNDKLENNNWNSLYVIQEIPNLSKYSNCYSPDNDDDNDDDNDNNSLPSKKNLSNADKFNTFDYRNSINSDYHQFYIENRPQSQYEIPKKGLKNAIRVSYQHLRNSIKLKPRKSSVATTDTGNTTIYSMDESDKDHPYTDIISFNDALNLPIEKNSK